MFLLLFLYYFYYFFLTFFPFIWSVSLLILFYFSHCCSLLFSIFLLTLLSLFRLASSRRRRAGCCSLPAGSSTQTSTLRCHGEPGPPAPIIQWQQRSRVLVQEASIQYCSHSTFSENKLLHTVAWSKTILKNHCCVVYFDLSEWSEKHGLFYISKKMLFSGTCGDHSGWL